MRTEIKTVETFNTTNIMKTSNNKTNIMKSLAFIGLFLVSSVGFAQTLTLEQNEVDEFTGRTKKATNMVVVAKSEISAFGNLEFMMARFQTQCVLYVSSSYDLGCSGANGNYIHFLFEDGTSVKYDKDRAKINCRDTNMSYYFVNSNDFKGKVVKKIRFAKSEAYNDYLWDSENSINDFFEIVK